MATACARHPRDRTPAPPAARSDREHRRHRDRVVRLLPVQHRHRTGVRTALFPELGSADRDAPGVRHLRRRIRRPACWRGDLRPLRRSPGTEVGADRHADADGCRDVPGRVRADARTHRDLGRGDPDRSAIRAGHRRRRRVGRIGPALDGMGAVEPTSRLHRVVAAVRRPCGTVPVQSGRAGIQHRSRDRSSCRGAGAFRSCSAPSSWRSASTSGSESWRRRCSRASRPRSASSARRWSRSSSVNRARFC